MKEISLIAVDLAKEVFQVCAVNRDGGVILNKRLNRKKFNEFLVKMSPCQLAMEACGGAHYWARKARELGYSVQLIPAQYVRPFVNTNKNDRNDAVAISEAARRPNLRTVSIRTAEAQAESLVHRSRERLVRSKVMIINQMRGFLIEFGITAAVSRNQLRSDFWAVIEESGNDLPERARSILVKMHGELVEVEKQIASYTKDLENWTKAHAVCQRLRTIPGVGPVTSSAIVAKVSCPQQFRNGREFSAYIGLVPKQMSSGDNIYLGRISKRGDEYIRRMLVHGARAVLSRARKVPNQDKRIVWAVKLAERKTFNKAAVALANKNARTIWRLMMENEAVYKAG